MQSWWPFAVFLAVVSCGRTGDVARSSHPPSDSAAPVVAPLVDAARALAAPEPPARCEDERDVHIFVSPSAPWTGASLRAIAFTDRPAVGELRITPREPHEKGKSADAPVTAASGSARRGGPPYFWIAELAKPLAGAYAITLVQSACERDAHVASRTVTVQRTSPARAAISGEGLWPVRAAWTHRLEQMYSVWIEALFDAPDDEMPSWTALQEVLRDEKRNVLFDYLGLGEDSANAPVIRPDCADLPYFLRAYFAFKLGLPFAVGQCDRGGGGAPPSCAETMTTNLDSPKKDTPAEKGAVKAFESFLRGALADKAHSGSARQPFEEENSDYYPVPLTWESLRPGTIYGDPYGHVLVVAKRLPQTDARGGALLAVDAQPDGTVARKRYWRGNFLYATERALGGPGFKRFRPLVLEKGALVRLKDDAIRANPDYADVSREAAKLDVESFYDKMDDVLSPRPLDPERALLETLGALEEQVRTRVKSVDNGRKWLETATAPAPMPEGAEIFETSGPWEDFSTPARDLRILIAIDVVRGFPARIARRPERYAMPPGRSGADVAADLERLLARELGARRITYTRTDGSPFVLSLQEVLARSDALEVAYDPNDCVETRWGAPAGSPEAQTCHAQAPPDQRARIESYRAWFHERRRPPRK